MRLVLHVGTHKTGTTSIQDALAANRQWLVDRGYSFPPLYGHRASHNDFAHRLALARAEDLEELRIILVGASDAHRCTILSGEEMSARIAGTRNWDGYAGADYWDRKLEYLQRLRLVVREFDDVVVHLCLRRADEFAESMYSTMIMSGRFRGSFAQFVLAVAPIFNYHRQIEAFRCVFPALRVISFDRLAVDLVPGFFRWTGIPVPPNTTQRKKVTPDKRLVYWISRMIEVHSDRDEQRHLWNKFARSSQNTHLFADRRPATFWSSQAQREEFVIRSGAGLPQGFFADAPVREFIEARLNDEELARVSDEFENWRSRPAAKSLDVRSVFSLFRRA
jgi:hypothetical protein